jgi:hypothetical protein
MMVATKLLPKVRPLGCEGIQIFGGRMEAQVTVGGAGASTYEFACELNARNATAIGSLTPIMAASRAATSPAEVAFIPQFRTLAALTDLDGTWGGTNAFWDDPGAAGVRVAIPVASSRRAWLYPRQQEITPVTRTDGGARPLVAGRVFVGSGNLALLGSSGGSDSFANWASRSAGLARFRVNSGSGDQRAATTGWVAANTGPLVGFGYSHNGLICNVMTIGDSIAEGRATYIGAGFGLVAVESVNASSPKTWFTHSNAAWSGISSVAFVNQLFDALWYGIVPDIVIFPIGTPNDPGNASITTAHVNNWRSRVARTLALCARYGITPIAYTMLPCNTAVNNWGTSDSLRTAYNAEMLSALAAAGVTIVDLASVFSGTTTGGQVQYSVGLTTDGIHPNDAGIAVGAPYIKAAIETVCGSYL